MNIFVSRLRDQIGWSRQRATLFVRNLAVYVTWTNDVCFSFLVITSIKESKMSLKTTPRVLWWLLNRNKEKHLCLLVHMAGPQRMLVSFRQLDGVCACSDSRMTQG